MTEIGEKNSLESELKDQNSIKLNDGLLEGRWSQKEHEKFLLGVINFGKDWKLVDQVIETRNSTQIRSHAQKYFLKFQKQLKERKKGKNKNKVLFTELEKELINFFNIDHVTKNTPAEFLQALRRAAGLEQQVEYLGRNEKKITGDKMTKIESNKAMPASFREIQVENGDEQSYFMRTIKHTPRGINGFIGLIDFGNRQKPEDCQTFHLPIPRKRSFGLPDDYQDEEKLKSTIKSIHEGNDKTAVKIIEE